MCYFLKVKLFIRANVLLFSDTFYKGGCVTFLAIKVILLPYC